MIVRVYTYTLTNIDGIVDMYPNGIRAKIYDTIVTGYSDVGGYVQHCWGEVCKEQQVTVQLRCTKVQRDEIETEILRNVRWRTYRNLREPLIVGEIGNFAIRNIADATESMSSTESLA